MSVRFSQISEFFSDHNCPTIKISEHLMPSDYYRMIIWVSYSETKP